MQFVTFASSVSSAAQDYKTDKMVSGIANAINRCSICVTLSLLFCPFTAQALQAQATVAAPASAATQAPSPAQVTQAANPPAIATGEVTEEELQRKLVGKQLFLRGGYLGDSLTFDEYGNPISSPLKGSFTLSGIEIEKVKLTKHKAEFEGARYALHYVGDSIYDDPSKEMDREKITPRKKLVKITIDRQQVTKQKEPKAKGKSKKTVAPTPQTIQVQEGGTGPKGMSTTTSPAHEAQLLRAAVDKIFAQGIDEKLRAQMPSFWQSYFDLQLGGVSHRIKDPSVLPASVVDQQAKLLTSIAPQTNQYAQAHKITGRGLYRAVIGIDGKPTEVAVLRPIGFGLDENAVEAIRTASFQPATKAGQPVAEALDLAVSFRADAKQTGVTGSDDSKPTASPANQADATGKAVIKPGPYSVGQQETKPQ